MLYEGLGSTVSLTAIFSAALGFFKKPNCALESSRAGPRTTCADHECS